MCNAIERACALFDEIDLDDTVEYPDMDAVDFYAKRMKMCKEDGVPEGILAYVNHAIKNPELNGITKMKITLAYTEVLS